MLSNFKNYENNLSQLGIMLTVWELRTDDGWNSQWVHCQKQRFIAIKNNGIKHV
jgi:hypothetical protein